MMGLPCTVTDECFSKREPAAKAVSKPRAIRTLDLKDDCLESAFILYSGLKRMVIPKEPEAKRSLNYPCMSRLIVIAKIMM
jgi:hypothetical protein